MERTGERWKGRREGGNKRGGNKRAGRKGEKGWEGEKEEKREREGVHNLRKTTPPRHQMAGYGHVTASQNNIQL